MPPRTSRLLPGCAGLVICSALSAAPPALPRKCETGCTTIVVGKRATADGTVMMAHNEDYGADDCMHLVHHPRQQHAPGAVIAFAFEQVPQVSATYAYTAIEMYSGARLGMPPSTFMDGLNEHGLAVASNCFESREPDKPWDKGLGWPEIGRLIMERCKTAKEAVELCAKLVDTYAFNGFEATSCKCLAFLMADPQEAWVMEVTRRHWVAKRCPDDGLLTYANQALIGSDWELASADLVPYAVSQGWYTEEPGKKLNFREVYCAPHQGQPGNTLREQRAQAMLASKRGRITLQNLKDVVRDHAPGQGKDATPHQSKGVPTICVSDTQSSQIYHLDARKPAATGCLMWSSAASPCLGAFVPIYAGYGGNVPQAWQTGQATFDDRSAWWTFEAIQRRVAPAEQGDGRMWNTHASRIRDQWDAAERASEHQAQSVEKLANALLQRGHTEEATRTLSNFTNHRLLQDFLKAQQILKGLPQGK